MENMLKPLAVFLFLLGPLLLSGCMTRVGADGQKETRFGPQYLAKTEIDRVIETDRAEVMAGMRRIAEKLYKRNPKERKKAGLASREAAMSRLFAGSVVLQELVGFLDGAVFFFFLG